MTGHTLRGAGLGLLAFAVFASHDVIVKFLGAQYSPFQVLFFSVMFSFPIVTVMLMRDRTPGNLLPVHPWWTALRTAATVITGLAVFYAFSVLPLAQTYAILFASPLLITLLAIPILNEQVRLRRGIAVAVGLAGVFVVLRPGATPLELGHIAAIVGAFTGALASVIVRKIGPEERSVVLLLYPMMANFVVMGAALPFVYRPMPVEHLGLWLCIAVLSSLGGLLLIAAYRAAPAVAVAPMQYSQIIWATLFGTLLFGERVDAATIVGAAIIILSGIYIVFREGRRDVSTSQPVLRTRSRVETGTNPRVGPMMRMGRPPRLTDDDDPSGRAQPPS